MKQEFTADDVIKIGAELRRQAIASATPPRAPGRVCAVPEEMAALLKQIEALLARQDDDQPGHRTHQEPPV